MKLRSLKYLLLGIVSFIINASGCQVELKAIDEARTLTCSDAPSTTSSYTWLFNNQTQVDSSVVVSTQGRAIMIPSGSTTVYGEYSCYENGSLLNCFSVYIGGICNQTCSELSVNNTTVIVNSTITFHLSRIVNTSPDDHGTMILRKDGSPVNGLNVNHTSLNLPQVTYYINKAQPNDSGVYDAEYIGMHATLFTNQFPIRVIEISFTSSSSQMPSPTFMMPQGTPAGNRSDDSRNSDDVGVIVGPVVGAVVGLIIITAIVAVVIWRCQRHGGGNCEVVQPEEESYPHSELPHQETNDEFYPDGSREDILQDGEPV